MATRYLTKSRYKVALGCPAKLYYKAHPETYADQSIDDPFLKALARGGFRVGALAPCAYPEGIEVRETEHQSALQRTAELMKREQVTLFEAAFCVGSLFVRVDILEKHGQAAHLIEVKAKSFDPTAASPFFDRRRRDQGLIKLFSHHRLEKGGRIVHAGDFLRTNAASSRILPSSGPCANPWATRRHDLALCPAQKHGAAPNP